MIHSRMCATSYKGAPGGDNKLATRIEYNVTHFGTKFMRILGEPEKVKARLKVKSEVRFDA